MSRPRTRLLAEFDPRSRTWVDVACGPTTCGRCPFREVAPADAERAQCRLFDVRLHTVGGRRILYRRHRLCLEAQRRAKRATARERNKETP